MSTKKRNPKWWQVYLSLPLLVGLFWLEMQIPLTDAENVIAQLGIVFLTCGLVELWLRANRSALMDLDEDEGQWGVRLYEIPPMTLRASDDPEPGPRERPILHIPASGVKGVLSDTFEWEGPEEESSVFANQGVISRKE